MIRRATAPTTIAGMVKQAQGDIAGAQADYLQALQLDAKNAEADQQSFLDLLREDRLGRCAHFTRTRRWKSTRTFRRRTTIAAWRSIHLNDVAGALADYDKALEADPNDEHAYNNRGLALQSRGDYDAAVADFDMALQIDPQFSQAMHNRALGQMARGRCAGRGERICSRACSSHDSRFAAKRYLANSANGQRSKDIGKMVDFRRSKLDRPLAARFGRQRYLRRGAGRPAWSK